MTRKFLFVDDHAVVRASFTKILTEPFNPVEVDEAGNGEEAIAKIKKEHFDLVLMDVQMPQTDTLGLVEYIINRSPGTKILMLSMAPENIHAQRYLKAGASGYISKQASLDEVITAIDLILLGKKYLSAALTDDILADSFVGKKGVSNPFKKLSRREFEIVTLLLQGTSLTDISTILNVAISTAGTHKSRLMEKLNVSNLMELKNIAMVYDL